VTGVLCVGCPRIFESARAIEGLGAFLLDADTRFVRSPSLPIYP